MPRTKLDADYREKLEAQRRQKSVELVNRTIDHALIDLGIRKLEDLADMISMPASTLYSKRKSGHWTHGDLVALRRVLKLTPEQSLNLIGG